MKKVGLLIAVVIFMAVASGATEASAQDNNLSEQSTDFASVNKLAQQGDADAQTVPRQHMLDS